VQRGRYQGEAGVGVGRNDGGRLEKYLADAKAVKLMPETEIGSVFSTAVQELTEQGLIITGKGDDGISWIAAKDAHITLQCRVVVWLRSSWRAYRVPVSLAAATVFLVWWSYYNWQSRQTETRRAYDLVPQVFTVLQSVAVSHQRNPREFPSAAILSSQLRDALLAETHSVAARKRLWDRVEAVVEDNANVRVAEEEVAGDLGKAWRWVGGAGTPGRAMEAKY